MTTTVRRSFEARRKALSIAAVAALAACTGCNAITGAGSLSLGEQQLASGEGTSEPGGGETTSGTTGGAGGGGSVGGGGGSASTCTYPSGPYGKTEGKIVNPALTWQGYPEGATEPTTVSIKDYYDCDGSRGIDALLLDTSAEWCGACQQEAADLHNEMPTWSKKGIRVLTLMIEDAAQKKGTVALAEKWRQNFKIEDQVAVVADPNDTFLPMGSVGLPLQVLVDPRTMTITKVLQGYGGPMPEIAALATKNAKP